MIQEAIAKLIERVDLEEEEIASVFDAVMEGKATPSQIAALLVSLRMKGETIAEITGAAKVMLDKAVKIHPERENVVDLCGTGGDGLGTFNISTVSSFIVAGADVPVAKHGNRSVSSPVGSADVLEQLGVNINLDAQTAEKCINETGIVFLFAPLFHPAMKNVAVPRKEIGVRTVFNLLGPLVNPALIKYQVMGVYSDVLLEPVAKTLRNLGSNHAFVVSGAATLDEITVTGKTSVAELKDGVVKTYKLDPFELGFKKRKLEELLGGKSSKENADIMLSVLEGEEKGAKRDVCLLNAAVGLVVSGVVSDMKDALDMAVDSLDSGSALQKLNDLIKFTGNYR